MGKYSIYGAATKNWTKHHGEFQSYTGSPSFTEFIIYLLRENTNTPKTDKEKLLTNMSQNEYF